MKKLLLTALMAISSLVSAHAEIHVVVSIRNQTAWLLDDARIILSSPVSTARRGMHTPTGEFEVSEKDTAHISSIYHVSMPYYMRLSGEPFGMHAGYLPGYPASHGCVRLPHDYAIAFFQVISVGTPVTVFGTTPRVRQYQVQNDYYQRPAQPQSTPQRRRKFLFGLFGF